jgi:hypothetical protein
VSWHHGIGTGEGERQVGVAQIGQAALAGADATAPRLRHARRFRRLRAGVYVNLIRPTGLMALKKHTMRLGSGLGPVCL